MSLVQMSLSGGAVILFATAVRGLALNRLPKGAFLALWEVAALRLLLPVSVPVPLSVLTRLPRAGRLLAAVPAREPGLLPAAPAEESVLPVIWLAGAAVLAAYFTASYLRGMRTFRTSVPDGDPAVRRWLAEQRLRRPLEVRQSDRVDSPLTYGIFRPVILLPKDMERSGEAALTYVLTHELVHVRRFDAAVKLVFAAALCAHWFNPLAWLMYVLAGRDLELSCDERVMELLGGAEKAPYALTLITMEEARSRGFSLYNHFGKLAIEERIEAIMKYKKASVLAVALAAVLVIGATTAFAAASEAVPQEDVLAGEIDFRPYDYETVSELPAVNAELTGGADSAEVVMVITRDGSEAVVPVYLEDGEPFDDIMLMETTLISVSHDDEDKFTPEQWAEILEQIDRGEVYWED